MNKVSSKKILPVLIISLLILSSISIYFLVYGLAEGANELDKDKLPYKNKWLSSYETLCFDTADGDLDKKQYALDEAGRGYYIRTKSRDESQFEHADLSYDISKLERVNVIPGAKCYYDEFLTAKGAEAIWGKEKKEMPSGGIIRIQSTAKKYWDTARIKNYPQPERIEMVKELPPPEPINPPPEHQSIAFDATSNSGVQEFVYSFSWGHTCTGSNGLLAVGVSHGSSEGGTVSSITYNGDSLTSIRQDDSSAWFTKIYYRVSPDTGGSYTIEVTFTYAGADVAVGGAISYTGAAQTGQPDAHGGATGTGETASKSITTVADNSWVASVFIGIGYLDTAPTSGNTQRWNTNYYQNWWFGGSDTNGPKTPAGSQTMSWSFPGWIDPWVISAASFAPAEEEEEEGLVGPGMVSSNYKIAFSSINVGGTDNQVSSPGGYRLAETIGEIATGPSASTASGYKLKAGYRQVDEVAVYISLTVPDEEDLVMDQPDNMGINIHQVTNTGTGAAWGVATNAPAGYTLSFNVATSDCLYDSGTGERFTDYTEEPEGTPESWSVATGDYEFGFSVFGDDVPDGTWGSGSSCFTPASNNLNYRGFDSTNYILVVSSSSSTAGTDTFLCLAAEQKDVFAPSGQYNAQITATAVTQ